MPKRNHRRLRQIGRAGDERNRRVERVRARDERAATHRWVHALTVDPDNQRAQDRLGAIR